MPAHSPSFRATRAGAAARGRHPRSPGRPRGLAAALAALVLVAAPASVAGAGEFRFPQPEFTSGYVRPVLEAPPPRAGAMEYADVAVLAVLLALASLLARRTRSRRALFLLSLLALLYFGFHRKGCICPVGAIQNVALALADPACAAPVAVVLFFVLPLFFALFFGRTFCAAVCPLGAVQDVVLHRAVRVPGPLARALALLPVVYLAAGVLLAANGAGFWICRYDPFVGFFRMSGPAPILLFGGALLLLGLFVARPYCRFLCPYGVLLGWASRLARRHLTITPDECIRCRLCENACPFDAIRLPVPETLPEDRRRARRRLVRLLAALPLLVAAGAGVGALAARPLARAHPTVLLSDLVRNEDAGRAVDADARPRTDAFRATGQPAAELHALAARRARSFAAGAPLAGAFVGLIAGLRLAGRAVYRPCPDYVPDRESCLSCGRCFAACPREHLRLGRLRGPMEEW